MTQRHVQSPDQRDEEATIRRALDTLAARGVADHADVMWKVHRKLSRTADCMSTRRWRHSLSALVSLGFLVTLVAVGLGLTIASSGAWPPWLLMNATGTDEPKMMAMGLPMALSADRSRVAFVNSHGKVTVWDLNRGQAVWTLDSSVKPPAQLFLGKDGSTVVVKEPDRLSVWLVDRRMRAWQRGLVVPDSAVALSSDGEWLAIAADPSSVELFVTRSGKRAAAFSFPEEGIAALSFGDGDRTVIVLTRTDRVRTKVIPSSAWEIRVVP